MQLQVQRTQTEGIHSYIELESKREIKDASDQQRWSHCKQWRASTLIQLKFVNFGQMVSHFPFFPLYVCSGHSQEQNWLQSEDQVKIQNWNIILRARAVSFGATPDVMPELLLLLSLLLPLDHWPSPSRASWRASRIWQKLSAGCGHRAVWVVLQEIIESGLLWLPSPPLQVTAIQGVI